MGNSTNQGKYWRLLLAEADGKGSTMRIVFLLWAAIALFTWLILSIKNGQVEEFPASIAGIIAALAVGKAAQRFAESR